LVIIAGGIVAMVHVFYGSSYDVRQIESGILSRRVANCISHGGELDKRLILGGVFRDSFRDHFMQLCGLTFEKKSKFEQNQYYLEINFYKPENLKNSIWKITEGDLNWKKDCNFKSENQKTLVKCSENSFYSVDDKNNVYLIKILSIVRKTEQNVN